MTAYAASRGVIAAHSKSFALAARLLPPAARDRAAAVYAWCRACDDAIDLGVPAEHGAVLAALERALASVYAGAASADPITDAFQRVVGDCRIPIEYPSELLAGMRMDVERRTYDTTDELLQYCFRVAGTVGLMMCHVLGVAAHGPALVHAAHLGMAMQLTNICRDVAEDWQRGRLYVPRDVLGAAAHDRLRRAVGGAVPSDAAPALALAVRSLLALADRYYASGDRGLAYLDWRAAMGVRTARLVYAEIGCELGRRGYDVLAGRAIVPQRRKLRLAARALRCAAADWRRRVSVEVPGTRLAAAEALAPLPGSA